MMFEFEEGGISAAIATPETDEILREDAFIRGMNAKLAGIPRNECPWIGGLCQGWWEEGWDSIELS